MTDKVINVLIYDNFECLSDNRTGQFTIFHRAYGGRSKKAQTGFRINEPI